MRNTMDYKLRLFMVFSLLLLFSSIYLFSIEGDYDDKCTDVSTAETSSVSLLESDLQGIPVAPLQLFEPPIVEVDNSSIVTEVVSPIEVDSCEVIPVYDYTDEELDLLARLIFSEGGIESYQTQLMIGSVVMNRVSDPAFPNTIAEVIYQENQFSVTFIEMDGVVMIDRPADEEAKKAAYEILTYGSILPHEVQVFFHKRITTGWVASREPYGTFDNTTFAYIYERRGVN